MKNDRSRADFYTLKAQKEGYPARSVYKLKEIDEKFRILGKVQTVADIGSFRSIRPALCLSDFSEMRLIRRIRKKLRRQVLTIRF